jgi:hypothetical protein
VTFKMMRCRYCATEGQSLQHIAAYWWGADWIQIWGANSFIRNPNKMRPNELLTLGPTYIVKVWHPIPQPHTPLVPPRDHTHVHYFVIGTFQTCHSYTRGHSPRLAKLNTISPTIRNPYHAHPTPSTN